MARRPRWAPPTERSPSLHLIQQDHLLGSPTPKGLTGSALRTIIAQATTDNPRPSSQQAQQRQSSRFFEPWLGSNNGRRLLDINLRLTSSSWRFLVPNRER